ncbi:glycoside hydrolase family 5 protein [Salinifilum ghardaiensis]
MNRKLSVALSTAVAVVTASFVGAVPSTAAGSSGTAAAPEAAGMHVENGKLLDANGNEFVMRGVNHAHAWYPEQLGSLADISEMGANTVRVALGTGDAFRETPQEEVAQIVQSCEENQLVCVLEVHDTTGYGEDDAAVPMSEAVEYWTGIQEALAGHEDDVLVNIGNEPFGNEGYESWATDTSNAINALREAGYEHTIVADAPNWGQDHTSTMRDNAAEVLESDPASNTMFSVHMYGVYETPEKINNYLNSFVDAGLPIMVGEFGHQHSDGNPDEDAIIEATNSLGLGYLGWSWSGNTGGVEYLDMVQDFDPAQLTEWGDRIFNGPGGIKETAKKASTFS